MKSGVITHCAPQFDRRQCITSRQVKASHRWWVCNELHHPAISPELGASKIVKISQQMAKLWRKLKWLVFSGTRCRGSCLHELTPCRSIHVARQKLSGHRSSSTVLNQVCLSLPVLHHQSLGGPRMLAWRAQEWSWLVPAKKDRHHRIDG